MTQSLHSWVASANSNQQPRVQHKRNSQHVFVDNLIIVLGHTTLSRLSSALFLGR